MTNTEAIKILNECRDRGFERTTYTIEEYHTARDMAIKALEQEPKYCDRNICLKNEYNGIGCDECEVTKSQEPCEDAISRKSIKHKLQEHHDFFVNAYGGFSNLPQNDKARVDEILNCIAIVVNEPSVKPQDCDTCEVGNPCLYCKHEFEPQADGEYISKEKAIIQLSWDLSEVELPRIKESLDKLPSVDIPPEHDGCKDCKYETYPDYYYPCCNCKQNYEDEWQKKPHWIMKHRTINEVKYHTGLDDKGEEQTIKELIRYEVDEPYCSECGMKAGDTSQNYCCFCGTKMGGEQDG